jgi:hypothetical protein
MAAPVRPPVWPPAQLNIQATNVRPGRNDAQLTAQKAFFEAALAGKPAAVPPEPPAQPAATPLQATRAAAATEARAADRLPPPGSIVNILV